VQASVAQRAVAAARSTASTFDLPVDATVVLNDSNRLVVRLMPCDVVARVTPPEALAPVTARASWLSGEAYQARLATEVEVVKRLAENDSPVAGLDPRVEPRVFVHDGFAITMWTYFAPVRRMLPSADYAQVLECLHAGLRQIDVPTPHFMDRVAATQQDVASRDVTPDLAETDRVLLANTLRDLSETDLCDVKPSVTRSSAHVQRERRRRDNPQETRSSQNPRRNSSRWTRFTDVK